MMIILSFLLFVLGCFHLLDFSIFSFLEELSNYIKPKKLNLKSKIEEAKKKKEPKGIKRLILEVKEILKINGKSQTFTTLCIVSMFLCLLGIFFAISMGNLYLVPVIAIEFSLLPFYYIKFSASRYKKHMTEELEVALSLITNSYMRGNNTIISAVEENIEHLNPPVLGLFQNFLMQTKLINSNLKAGLEVLKLGLNNQIFHEWVDGVMICIDDYSLKPILPTIVSKLSDTRIISGELDVLLFEPVKEYITMLIMFLGSIPLMYFLNIKWYETLMHTTFGQIMLAICTIVIFCSIGGVAKYTRPIEYNN